MKKNILYTWILGIGTSVIGSFIYDYWKDKPTLTTLVNIFNAIWSFFFSLLNFDLKVWWILIAILLFVGVLYLIQRFQTEEKNEPDFVKYKEDTFKNWRWTWNWTWDKRIEKWTVIDLQPNCHICHTALINESNFFEQLVRCPRCGYEAKDKSQIENTHDTEVLIIDNVKKKNFSSRLSINV